MDAATTLRHARERADLTQRELAVRAGTSQATLSAYENGRKEPSVATLSRLLAAAGTRLTAEPAGYTLLPPSPRELERRARILTQVIEFAETFPGRRHGDLRYPRIVR